MRTVVALLGAAMGYGIGIFASDRMCAAMGVPDTVTQMPAAFIILGCGAVFCAFGIRLTSVWAGKTGRTVYPSKWQATLAAIGAAIGPLIGYFAVYCLNASGRSEVHGPMELVGRLFFGCPMGAILFCLLGLYLGSILDRRSQKP